ncbi:conserved hypothetical protein [Uncinocarpus reesii 1704]|uniref:Diphthamide biosynthesis protein 4 n=1 Tax=Uncinocarpus reesii (strain UAMH 1704) TaxID=336963 RepID=C4JG61_UNCRE|nr:uncharacterized protein UREG_02459 [Uncinocarpus reesii 1704]EEP77610.1 conserved hypothetical protein [Uncinocarpus reesii 1704]
MGESTFHATHYDILELPYPPTLVQKAELKGAYHRALLKHHPDKSSSSTPSRDTTPLQITASRPGASQAFTVDQITAAYKVLSDPRARIEYDRSLVCLSSADGGGAKHSGKKEGQPFHTGLEVFDLDDMQAGQEPDGAEFWYQGCRCGDQKGFLVSEGDLENELERGEIMVGCQGCSLWAKILFAVDEGGQEVNQVEDGVDGNS